MKEIKSEQIGFGALEALLVLLIVGSTGSIGWYIYQLSAISIATQNQ